MNEKQHKIKKAKQNEDISKRLHCLAIIVAAAECPAPLPFLIITIIESKYEYNA